MKPSGQKFLSVALASLPLLGLADSFHSAFKVGGIAVLVFWLTVLFFGVTRALFPQRLLGMSLILWVAFVAEAVTTYAGNLSPLWSLSLLVLLFPLLGKDLHFSPRDSWRPMASASFQQGIGFLILLVCVGSSREVFRKLGVGFFDQPAGVFFLIAFAGWLWQNQPGAGGCSLQPAENDKG